MIALDTLLKKAVDKLNGVHPVIVDKALQLVTKAHSEKIYIIITQGFRSIAEQDKLYAQGRTTSGSIVTNAKGGYSYHNYGLAFDFAVLDNISTVNWNVDNRWKRVGALGKSLGLEWGGDWTSFKDYPHFQHTFGLSLAQLRKGDKPPMSERKTTKVSYNGKIITGFIEDSTTYVPLRSLSELLGFKVNYDNKTGNTSITK